VIASAFTANGDLLRARARLGLLQDDDLFRTVSEQAQRTMAQNSTSQEARALGLLAIAIGQADAAPDTAVNLASVTPVASSTATSTPLPTGTPTNTPEPSATSSPLPTNTPLPPSETPTSLPASLTPTASATPDPDATATETPIPRPTRTPTLTRTATATPGGPFVLVSREKICTQVLSEPLIQIEANNLLNQPVPGALVIITWEDGEERFFTGLQPEKGLGYADFSPVVGVLYNVRLGEGGETAVDLDAVRCTQSGGADYWGAWLLKFIQT
jgi:hypothetical protein